MDQASCVSSFKAGTFEGSVRGSSGDVKVAVTLTEEKVITSIEIKSTEIPDIGEVTVDLIVEKVVAGNTLDVDTIVSATVSCETFFAAYNAVLESAGITAADFVVFGKIAGTSAAANVK